MLKLQKHCPETVSVFFFYDAMPMPVKVPVNGKKPVVNPAETVRMNAPKFNVASALQRKGMKINIHPVHQKDENPALKMPDKNDGLLLLVQEVAEFNRLTRLAQDCKRMRHTLILWNGSEQDRPKAKKIPVISLKEIKDAPSATLDWNDLCGMAEQGEKPAQQPIWKNVAAMF